MEAVVTFDYEAMQDDEIDLKVGQVITDVQNVDEGWCEGVLNGKKGMFPDNFVQIREPTQPPPAAEPDGGAPQIRAMPQSKKSRRAKVSFSYAADNIDELSLEPGQVVEVIAEEEEGWWRGKLGGKEGVFPSNFVEIIEEAAEPAKPAVTNQAPPPQQSAPPNRPPSPVETTPEPQVSSKPKIGGGPMMPKFDPSQALAKLKKSSVDAKKPPPASAAPPPSSVTRPPPPSSKASPPDMSQNISTKSVEKAKVTFEYDADNEDELTIRVGDIVEIVNKNTDNDGWWEVRLGDRVGLIPDNFVDILPASPPEVRRPSATARPAQPPPPQETKPVPIIPSKPPGPIPLKKKPPEPGRKPPKPEPHPHPHPPPSSAATTALTPDKETSQDFGVPSTQPLDSSAIKNRPKNKARPPSRSNLLQHLEEEGGSLGNGPSEPAAPPEKPTPAPAPTTEKPSAAPWQRELLEKKKKPPLPKPAPKAPTAPKPTTPSKPSSTAISTKPAVPSSRPEPPKAHIEPKPTPPVSAAHKESAPLRRSDTPPVIATVAAASATATPSPSPASPPTSSSNNEWKEAFENLRDEFEKFKKFVIGEISTLTEDLDKEIKHRAALEVDIGRLKKSRGFPH